VECNVGKKDEKKKVAEKVEKKVAGKVEYKRLETRFRERFLGRLLASWVLFVPWTSKKKIFFLLLLLLLSFFLSFFVLPILHLTILDSQILLGFQWSLIKEEKHFFFPRKILIRNFLRKSGCFVMISADFKRLEQSTISPIQPGNPILIPKSTKKTLIQNIRLISRDMVNTNNLLSRRWTLINPPNPPNRLRAGWMLSPHRFQIISPAHLRMNLFMKTKTS